MDRRAFTQRVEQEARVALGQEVRLQVVNKGDHSYEGLSLRKTVSAVADLDHFYDELETKSYDEVFDEILKILTTPAPFEAAWIKDFGFAEDKLFVSLVSQSQKRSSVGRDFGDLYAEVRVLFDDTNGIASCLVTSELAELWQVDEEELFELALKNAETLMPVSIKDLGCTVGLEEVGALVVSTRGHIRGACSLLYEDTCSKVKALLDSDFIAIPSSKHEWICVPFSKTEDIDRARQILRSVNLEVVEAEDFLSNEVYVYSQDKLVCATMGVPVF